jgi:hypothetical protein
LTQPDTRTPDSGAPLVLALTTTDAWPAVGTYDRAHLPSAGWTAPPNYQAESARQVWSKGKKMLYLTCTPEAGKFPVKVRVMTLP